MPLVSETLPRDVVPSLKITLPVGVPAPGSVGGNGRGEGHRLPEEGRIGTAVTLVVVAAWLTTWTKAGWTCWR